MPPRFSTASATTTTASHFRPVTRPFSQASGSRVAYRATITMIRKDGRVNPRKAATPPASVPGAPQIVSTEVADSQIEVAWSAPAADGGAVITGYKIELSTTSAEEGWSDTVANTDSAATERTSSAPPAPPRPSTCSGCQWLGSRRSTLGVMHMSKNAPKHPITNTGITG